MHHRQMLTETLLASLIRFAKPRDVALLQALVASTSTEACFPLLFRRRFLEGFAGYKAMICATLRADFRRRRRAATFCRRGGSGRNLGARQFGARLARVDAAHRADISL